MVDKCIICGKDLRLFKTSNVSLSKISSYAYSSRKVPEYMHWDLYECEECSILYSDCPSNTEEIYEKYENADYDSSDEANDASNTYYKYLKQKMPDFPRNKALDIGTGNGSYLLNLKNGGVKDVVGIEPSREPIKHADSLVKEYIKNIPFQAGIFGNGEFDMVSLFQTVEHIPEPISIFREVRRILVEGGYFYVICHDYCSLVNRFLGMKSPIYDIEHLQILSKKSIVRLMKKSGFKDVKVFTVKNRYPLKYWVRLFPIPLVIKKRIMDYLNKYRIGKLMIGINVGNVGVIARK